MISGLIWLIWLLVRFGLWAWAMYDIVTSTVKDRNVKIIWALVATFVPFGIIIYFFFGRDNKQFNNPGSEYPNSYYNHHQNNQYPNTYNQ